MPGDTTESVAEHSTRLQPSINLHAPVTCSAVVAPNVLHRRDGGSGKVSFHQYADDTQLYIGTNSSTLTSQIASVESCTQRVHNWLLNNGLHLNPFQVRGHRLLQPQIQTSCYFSRVDWNSLGCWLSN